MRRLITLGSKGNRLVATLDLPDGLSARVGVLIVSGGNEIRAGAHRGQAMLAAGLAREGVPVLRFDRAGVGDSTGENVGFAGSLHDIFDASLVLANETGVQAIVGVGNCDAATALALFGSRSGVKAVVLTNPWLRDEVDALPPAAAIRARYLGKVFKPREWWRFVQGQTDMGKLARGIAKAMRRPDPPPLDTLDGIAVWGERATIVLARGDATAIAFAAAAAGRVRTVTLDTASHSFAGEDMRDALVAIILDRVRKTEAALDAVTPPPAPVRHTQPQR